MKRLGGSLAIDRGSPTPREAGRVSRRDRQKAWSCRIKILGLRPRETTGGRLLFGALAHRKYSS
jgi:hypothetical protein